MGNEQGQPVVPPPVDFDPQTLQGVISRPELLGGSVFRLSLEELNVQVQEGLAEAQFEKGFRYLNGYSIVMNNRKGIVGFDA